MVSALHREPICDLRLGGRLSPDGEAIMQDGTSCGRSNLA